MLSADSGPVVWYVISPEHFDEALRILVEPMKGYDPDWNHVVESRRIMVHPWTFISRGVPVTRHVQRAGEWVVLAPGALHWGVNCTVSSKCALNWVPNDIKRWVN
jgi:hypothetical protein